MTHDDVPVEVSIEPTIRCDEFFMARAFIESGLGIGYLPDLMVRGRRSGVRRVVSGLSREGHDVFRLPFIPARVRHFIRAAEWDG